MSGARTVLVTGATGKQGGAVARALLARGWRVRALSRDPNQPSAQALQARGADVVRGDLGDRATLDRVLDGVDGVFSVQNFYEHGFEGEIRQGKALADVAKARGVQHFVYSSVGGAERQSGIHHFESKWQIEEHIRAAGLPATILRPVFLMENFLMPNYRGPILSGTLPMALPPAKPLQMIAVDDVGEFAARAFEQPDAYLGQAIEIAGEVLTLPEVAAVFSRVLGRPVRFVEVPLDRLRAMNPDVTAMFAWFNAAGYAADMAAVRALYPDLLTLEAWARKTGWDKLPASPSPVTVPPPGRPVVH